MALKFNSSFFIKCAHNTFETLIGRSLIGLTFNRHLSVTNSDLGRTQWSYTRPRNTGRPMDIPKRLLDGKMYRNQSKGGRDHTGKVVMRFKGGGAQRNWRIVDQVRVPLPKEGEEAVPIKDRVLQIGYDPFRTGDLALVAGNGSMKSRLILAPHEMKVGDIITSYRGKPESLARMIPGDAYSLRYLPVGTMVCHVEKIAGEGATFCKAAGTFATIQSKTETHCVIKTRSNVKERQTLHVDLDSLAVIGRGSNPDISLKPIGKAGRSRWLNRRPRGKTGKDRRHKGPGKKRVGKVKKRKKSYEL